MFRSTLRIIFFILISPTLAVAEVPEHQERLSEYKIAFKKLISAKSIECYFPQGVLANWKGKTMVLEEDRFSNAVHFDNIDISGKGRARLIGNLGATDVLAFATPTGITFIEKTDIGNFIYTTIFPSYLGDKKINSEPQKNTFLFQEAYIAVTSRHGYHPITGATPSQFHGYCRILE
ncbi:hypothetical protein [Legionella impletisoli]|uniref:Uncharacterized protein n=1 Tax=Legionella impletisoli TaxID=343510 RepID=A0A917JS67_9GAMM|nr:hypothetical protein [Legionella impletisoli]GGI82671.1 hypothetical protein GCM10007966_09120 [Legionella impletisoli]